MDASSLMVGLIILALCILPFVWVSLSNRSKAKKLSNDFKQVQTKYGVESGTNAL